MSAEYKILSSDHGPHKLAEDINDLIEKGWKPVGGVTASYNGSWTIYCQAILREIVK